MKIPLNRWLFTTQGSGSTLMCALLCKTIRTYCEPPSIDHIPTGSCIEPWKNLVHLAPEVKGPKVFLYRSLPSHLGHMLQLSEWDLATHTKEWARILNLLLRSEDVIWIESNSFFSNVQSTLDTVCEHFKIPPINNITWSEHNVKMVVVQGQLKEPLRLNPPPQDEEGDYHCINGIIERDRALAVPEIKQAVAKAVIKYPNLEQYM